MRIYKQKNGPQEMKTQRILITAIPANEIKKQIVNTDLSYLH